MPTGPYDAHLRRNLHTNYCLHVYNFNAFYSMFRITQRKGTFIPSTRVNNVAAKYNPWWLYNSTIQRGNEPR